MIALNNYYGCKAWQHNQCVECADRYFFNDDAIFKYTDFQRGVTFESAIFEESLNIKYLEVRGDFNIDRMEVSDDIDAKYTEINGESFTKYLYKSRRN